MSLMSLMKLRWMIMKWSVGRWMRRRVMTGRSDIFDFKYVYINLNTNSNRWSMRYRMNGIFLTFKLNKWYSRKHVSYDTNNYIILTFY